MARLTGISKNLSAFLDMVAESEIGIPLLSVSDDGYNVVVGSTPAHPNLFPRYTEHPHELVHLSASLASSAAGRYQLLGKYYDAYKVSLHLPDFSPESQDKIAIQQIRECHALPDIEAGRISLAIEKCSHIWASLPGAGYGQHENKLTSLLAAYQAAGGAVV